MTDQFVVDPERCACGCWRVLDVWSGYRLPVGYGTSELAQKTADRYNKIKRGARTTR